MSNKTLSVVLPCYNPDTNWAVNILIRYNEIARLLPNYQFELILVNDGSSNDIDSELQNLGKEISHCYLVNYTTNKGKGYAIREGVKKASGDFIVYTDVDFPYTNDSFVQIVEGLNDADVTIGTRGNSYYHNIPIHRALISKLLKFLIKASLRIPTNDTQGGLKGMRNTAKSVFLKTEINRYLFDLEFVCLATKNKQRIKLIPVVLNEQTIVRKMNLKVVSKELINFFKVYARMVFS